MSTPSRAYIIHLPEDSRRLRNVERLTHDLHAAGVAEVEVFPGIKPADSGPMFSRGEWGCYQSHVACLRRIAAEPAAGPALVVEDDAVLRVSPEQLRRLFDTGAPWDFLHAGYLSNTVFRAWDEALMSRDLIRVRGVLYGSQCYAVNPRGLDERCDVLDRLPYEAPADGGGVGIDGALCELAWRDPALVRLAPPTSLYHTLPGAASGLRKVPLMARGNEVARAALRHVRKSPPKPSTARV